MLYGNVLLCLFEHIKAFKHADDVKFLARLLSRPFHSSIARPCVTSIKRLRLPQTKWYTISFTLQKTQFSTFLRTNKVVYDASEVEILVGLLSWPFHSSTTRPSSERPKWPQTKWYAKSSGLILHAFTCEVVCSLFCCVSSTNHLQTVWKKLQFQWIVKLTQRNGLHHVKGHAKLLQNSSFAFVRCLRSQTLEKCGTKYYFVKLLNSLTRIVSFLFGPSEGTPEKGLINNQYDFNDTPNPYGSLKSCSLY